MVNRYNIIGRLVKAEMEMVRSMGLEEMDDYVYSLIRAKWESADNDIIIEEYEALA